MRKIVTAALIALLLLCPAIGCTERDQSSPGRDKPSEQAAPAPGGESRSEPARPDASSQAEAESETEESAPQIIRLTVPEGYTLARIGMALEEYGVCTAEEFIDAAQTGDFSAYPLVAAQQQSDERCFKLEGYLFPDTYEIYATDTPDAIIRRMLDHLEQKITAGLRAQIEASGYTVDEVLALASIIEKESFGPGPMPDVSSVLHNRMDIGMQLQCDVTITYVEGAIKPFISGDKDRYNQYYNTYKCPALPAGAICNPGMDAIQAALTPAQTDYLFFITDQDQNYLFAATWEEHLVNLDKAGL